MIDCATLPEEKYKSCVCKNICSALGYNPSEYKYCKKGKFTCESRLSNVGTPIVKVDFMSIPRNPDDFVIFLGCIRNYKNCIRSYIDAIDYLNSLRGKYPELKFIHFVPKFRIDTKCVYPIKFASISILFELDIDICSRKGEDCVYELQLECSPQNKTISFRLIMVINRKDINARLSLANFSGLSVDTFIEYFSSLLSWQIKACLKRCGSSK